MSTEQRSVYKMLRLPADVHKQLRLLAALSDESLWEVVARLVAQELARVQVRAKREGA